MSEIQGLKYDTRFHFANTNVNLLFTSDEKAIKSND